MFVCLLLSLVGIIGERARHSLVCYSYKRKFEIAARMRASSEFSLIWESEASPTQGCSIEISRDICVGRSVCLLCPKYVGSIRDPRACLKSFLGGKN